MPYTDERGSVPIPAQFLAPWVVDNQAFLAGLALRSQTLEQARALRQFFTIHTYVPCAASPLAAVDAAVVDAPIGDMLSILIQVVHVADSGITQFGAPIRMTGVNGHDLSLARIPLRVAAECQFLATSESITIADTSFWSLLMEVNLVITRRHNGGAGNDGIDRAYHTLITDGLFLKTLRNPNVIAMSKTGQACSLMKGLPTTPQSNQFYLSDRELLGQLLEAGEFLAPKRLVEFTEGRFGIEERGFRDGERQEIREIYEQELGVTYFKPHPWARALRLEAPLRLLNTNEWLMPLLSAITTHTADRTAEPWPQFLADWNTKHVEAIRKLYGPLNFHRTPYFDPARTL